MASHPKASKEDYLERARAITDSVARGLDGCAIDLYTLHAEKGGPDFNEIIAALKLLPDQAARIREGAMFTLSRNQKLLNEGRLDGMDEKTFRRDAIIKPATYFGIKESDIGNAIRSFAAPGSPSMPQEAPAPAKPLRKQVLKGLDALKDIKRQSDPIAPVAESEPAKEYKLLRKKLREQNRACDLAMSAGSSVEAVLPHLYGAQKTLEAMQSLSLPVEASVSRSEYARTHEAAKAELKDASLQDLFHKSLTVKGLTRGKAIYDLGMQLTYTGEVFGHDDSRFIAARNAVMGSTKVLKSLLSHIDTMQVTADTPEERQMANAMLGTLYPDTATRLNNQNMSGFLRQKLVELSGRQSHSLH